MSFDGVPKLLHTTLYLKNSSACFSVAPPVAAWEQAWPQFHCTAIFQLFNVTKATETLRRKLCRSSCELILWRRTNLVRLTVPVLEPLSDWGAYRPNDERWGNACSAVIGGYTSGCGYQRAKRCLWLAFSGCLFNHTYSWLILLLAAQTPLATPNLRCIMLTSTWTL